MSSSLGDGYVTDTDYHPAGMVTSMLHPVGAGTVNRSRVYQAATLNLLATRAGSGASTTNQYRIVYGYDAEGRVSYATDYDNAQQTTCYTYDAYNRLYKAYTRGDDTCASGHDSAVGANPINHTYSYDTVGRLGSMAGVGAYTYHATKRHRLTGAGAWSYGYDAAGNMTSRDNATTVDQALTWDTLGRVESVDNESNGDDTVLWYDADGNRVARVDNGTVTVQIDGMFEWTSSSGFTWYYQHGGETIASRTTAGVTWMFSDRQGSVVATRDPAGTLHRRRYFPYGRVRGTSTVATEHGYTSQRLDPTGLMDYHARLYDPWTGRFISPDSIVPDPANPHDLNRYSYTRNNPINYTDPTGHWVDQPSDCHQGWSNGACRRGLVSPFTPSIVSRSPAPGRPRGESSWGLDESGSWWHSVITASVGVAVGGACGIASAATAFTTSVVCGAITYAAVGLTQRHLSGTQPAAVPDAMVATSVDMALGAGIGATLHGIGRLLMGTPGATTSLSPRTAGFADDVATTGARATGHGSERLAQAGFTDDLVAQTKASLVTRQADGATVFVREVSPGRFDFIVEGQRGVITAHRNWSQKSIDRLARNYGWEGWPP